jgi:GNAT superfamily N-acetyltransferase
VAPQPRIQIRALFPSDVPALVPLLEAYMQEAYGVPWRGSAEALHRDCFGQHCSLLVAQARDGDLIGFLAWMPSYDLHHCVSGADVNDLYVVPRCRGRGVALLLGCAVAAEVAQQGGRYLKGTAVETGTGSRLYDRFGICNSTGCVVSGRAFRRLAELAGHSVRQIVRALPDRSWNYQA